MDVFDFDLLYLRQFELEFQMNRTLFIPGPPEVFIDSHKTDLMASNQRQRHL